LPEPWDGTKAADGAATAEIMARRGGRSASTVSAGEDARRLGSFSEFESATGNDR
jgi:hypothetical protein